MIRFAKDYSKTSKKPTMVNDVDTLAYKLWVADYYEALNRLAAILHDLGMHRDTFDWIEDSGETGRYSRMRKLFSELVDGYLVCKVDVGFWRDYFSNAPAVVAGDARINELKTIFQSLEMFLDGGFEQEIDDQETILKSKPREFITYMEKVLNEHKSDISQIEISLMELKKLAREYRNKHYDMSTVNTVNLIRNMNRQEWVNIDQQSTPGEITYLETQQKVLKLIKELELEGNNFFKQAGAKRVTFAFFKEVVEKDAGLDWTSCVEEKRELEQLGLIETKVVLRR